MTEKELGILITFNLKKAKIFYDIYLSNGKKYIYAKLIKKANDSIQKAITDYIHLLPEILEKDMLSLMEHLEIWTERWLDLEKKCSPSLDDEFIFPNKHQFPKDACNNITNYFKNKTK